MSKKQKVKPVEKDVQDPAYVKAIDTVAKTLGKLDVNLQRFVVCSAVAGSGRHVLNIFSLCCQADTYRKIQDKKTTLTKEQEYLYTDVTLRVIDSLLGPDAPLN